GVDDASLYRLRTATDTTWQGSVAFKRKDSVWHRIGAAFRATGRLVLPVLLLVSTLAALYLYLDTRLGLLEGPDGARLTIGHAILPGTFFVVALTNRRYGATYAFLQVLLAGALFVAAFLTRPDELQGLLPPSVSPGLRVGSAFGVAFFLASFLSI